MPLDVMNVEQRMSDVVLDEDSASDSTTPATSPWLSDPAQVEEVRNLKDLALGNCRLLYGSERSRFYDVVTCSDEESQTFCAILTCNVNAETRLLRKSVSTDIVAAVRSLVDRLQKDTALLFTKYDVGSNLFGQQGFVNSNTGKWEMDGTKQDDRPSGPVDFVPASQLQLNGKRMDRWPPLDAPRRPRAEQNGYKRARTMDYQPKEDEIHISDLY